MSSEPHGKRIAIYGAGGFARHIAWLIDELLDDLSVACFIDDNVAEDTVINGITVHGPGRLANHRKEGFHFVCAIAAPAVRQQAVGRLHAEGCAFVTVIAPDVLFSRKWVRIGKGSVVCSGTIIDPNVQIGDFVHVNKDCTIGHDVVMNDFVTLAPGVHVGGYVTFEERARVGLGAVILNGTHERRLVIGEGAVVGAGACVTESVPPGTTVVGVPAKPRGR